MCIELCHQLAKQRMREKRGVSGSQNARELVIESLELYMVNPCHVVGSKHTVYFARNKIKGADVVGSIHDVTSLTNRFPKLINLFREQGNLYSIF